MIKSIKKCFIFRVLFFLLFIFTLTKYSYSQESVTNADVNISWQTIDSYTPPFYEGRVLPADEAYIKLVGEAKISTPAGDLDNSKLFYDWEYNGNHLYDWSVTNGKTAYITLDMLKNSDLIDLKIYLNQTKGTLLGEKQITITPYPTFIGLYKQNDNPILTYSNTINKKYEYYNVATNDSFNIIAEPFYFSIKDPSDKDLSFGWSLNTILSNENYSNIFNYTAPENQGVDSGISLKLENQNQDKNLQEADTLINFNINQKNSQK